MDYEHIKNVYGKIGSTIISISSGILAFISYSILALVLAIMGAFWWILPSCLIYYQSKRKIKTEETKRLKQKYE